MPKKCSNHFGTKNISNIKTKKSLLAQFFCFARRLGYNWNFFVRKNADSNYFESALLPLVEKSFIFKEKFWVNF